jgi:hypothetical protein
MAFRTLASIGAKYTASATRDCRESPKKMVRNSGAEPDQILQGFVAEEDNESLH